MIWRPKKKNECSFRASIAVDDPDVKIVEGRLHNKPAILLVGTSEQRKVKVAGEVGHGSFGAEYQSQKGLKWKILINRKNLPDFEPLDKKRKLKKRDSNRDNDQERK
jgi:hypothetical protein